jgi:hypothetical protein
MLHFSPHQLVSCPVCGMEVSLASINVHLDAECTAAEDSGGKCSRNVIRDNAVGVTSSDSEPVRDEDKESSANLSPATASNGTELAGDNKTLGTYSHSA